MSVCGIVLLVCATAGLVGLSTQAAHQVSFAAGIDPSGTPGERSSTSPSPTPTPTPERSTGTESVQEPIPFTSRTESDPSLAKGTTRVKSTGVPGLRTKTYEVTYVDGVEVARTLIRNVINRQPVAQVTVVGTYVAPAKPAPLLGGPSGCDPNYTGACVPIASDVDCAGGGGDGPKYLTGTARVVGRDIYGLDRNHDGIACN